MHKIVVVILSLICVSLAHAAGDTEVRAVWLTTNSGLDWPGKVLSESGQKKLMIDMLDRLKSANFNLVIFQVQANGDVLWKSSLQPAMEAVTGNASSGLSYDVCKFVIDECHKRDMECHAWIVPFRLGSKKFASHYASNAVKHPLKSQHKLCVNYKGTYYFDPGNSDTRKFLIKLYRELVENYDFDGINLDYTRYPGKDFLIITHTRNVKTRKMSRDDWRRENINVFVEELYKMAKSVKPDMLVGSAPIGTYKNVENYRNATAYDSFQQDPGKWISDGCHDLVIPQMYWDEKAGFSTHLKTWKEIAVPSCHLVVGLAPYKMVESGWDVDQVLSQIEKVRKADGAEGVCFFRAEHVLGKNAKSKALYNRLKSDIFKSPAKLPWRVAFAKEESVEPVNPFLE